VSRGAGRVEADGVVVSWPGGWGGSGCLAVLVDESAAGGVSSDRPAGPTGDDVGIVGRALTEAAVGPVGVVVLEVVVEESLEVSVVPDQGAVAELAADRTDPSFCVCVRDGRIGRGADDGGAVASEDVIERGDELAGAVADHEPDRSLVAHHEIAGGLSRPRAGWVRRHAGKVHAATVEFNEEQHVVATQHDGIDTEEVAGENPVGAENPSGTAHLRLCRSGSGCAMDLRNCAIRANSPVGDAADSSLEGLQPGLSDRTVSRCSRN
jgi:hypothetical protein